MPNGQRYSGAASAGKRAAWPVVQEHVQDKPEKQCRAVIATWIKNGVLIAEDYDDPVDYKPRSGLKVVQAKRPS